MSIERFIMEELDRKEEQAKKEGKEFDRLNGLLKILKN